MFIDNDFVLMNKDNVVKNFSIVYDQYNDFKFIEESKSYSPVPVGYKDIHNWLANRQAPKHREHINELLKKCGCDNLDGYMRITHALTLNDTFWVKPVDSALEWNKISLYKNEFNEVIARIAFEGGMQGELFSSTSPEFGTDGNYAKCWVREKNDDIYLIKGGSQGARNTGREPFSECYAAQLAKLICKNSVSYEITKFHNKVASKCKLFSSEQEGYVPASRFFSNQVTASDIEQFYSSYDMLDDFRRMVILDALIINVDRHLGNHGVMINNDSMEVLRMAPIFDNNLSLCPGSEPEDFVNMSKFLSEQKPKIGSEFCEIANKLLTPHLKAELKNLKDFRYEPLGNIDISDERRNLLNDIYLKQLNGILDYKSYYMSVIKPYEKKADINEIHNLDFTKMVERSDNKATSILKMAYKGYEVENEYDR